MANQPRSIFKPLPCDCCGRTISHPTWWRSDDEYIPLCSACVELGTESFTAHNAIHQAWAITKIHWLINDAPARYCGVFDD